MSKHKGRKKSVKKTLGAQVAPRVPIPQRSSAITPIPDAEKGIWTKMVIGYATCPLCRKLMKVINDDGIHGNPFFDYIENHHAQDGRGLETEIPCINSGSIISKLFG